MTEYLKRYCDNRGLVLLTAFLVCIGIVLGAIPDALAHGVTEGDKGPCHEFEGFGTTRLL